MRRVKRHQVHHSDKKLKILNVTKILETEMEKKNTLMAYIVIAGPNSFLNRIQCSTLL